MIIMASNIIKRESNSRWHCTEWDTLDISLKTVPEFFRFLHQYLPIVQSFTFSVTKLPESLKIK
jgi:hypothetical protein